LKIIKVNLLRLTGDDRELFIKYSYVVGKRVKFGPKTGTSCEEMGALSKKVNFNISAPLWDVPSLFVENP
jgi:hypothetical protein